MRQLTAIFIFFLHIGLFAQTDSITVSGTITDDQGEPLIACGVIVKGTTNGTMADIDGKYSISAPKDATLKFFFIGFKAQEIEIEGRSTIDITLKEDDSTLTGCPVYSYSTYQHKNDLSTSISGTIDIFSGRPNTVESLINGFNKSAYYNPFSGINIRGGSSIAGNDVMYVVDGIPDAPFNPADVIRYQITSDPASSSVFDTGMASGGIILITTKKGLNFTPLEADVWVGLQQASSTLPGFNKSKYDDNLRTGLSQHYYLRTTKRSNRWNSVEMNTSFSYDNAENTVRSSNSEHLMAQINANKYIYRSLKLDQTLFYNRYSERHGLLYDNNPGKPLEGSSAGVIITPYKPADRIYSATTLSASPRNFRFRSTFSYDYTDSSDKSATGYDSFIDIYNPDYDYRSVYNGRTERLMWNNTASYSHYIDGHNIGFTAGYTYTQDRLRPLNADDSGNYSYTTGKDITNNLMGLFTYNYWDGGRTFTTAIRRTESSKLKPDKDFAYFPSVSAGWNIVRERFWDCDFFSILKLKAAWGRTGSTRSISPFSYERKVYSNLKWTITDQRNIGINTSFSDRYIYITADYFYKKTYNLLEVVPSAAGTMITSGKGQLINRGWEFSASNRLISNSYSTLVIEASYSHYKSDVRHNSKQDNDPYLILGEYNTPRNMYNLHIKYGIGRFDFAMLFHGASDLKTGYTYGDETKTDYYGLKMLNVSYMLKDRYSRKPQIRLYLNAENLFTKVNTGNKNELYNPLYLLPINRAISAGVSIQL